MPITRVTGKPANKFAGEWKPQGKGPHNDPEVRVAYNLMHAPAVTRWVDNVALTQFRLTFVEDGALVMLKGTRNGTKLVAWFKESTWLEALVMVASSIDCGAVEWLVDNPPKWQKR